MQALKVIHLFIILFQARSRHKITDKNR